MNRSTAEHNRPTADKKRKLRRRLPKLSPDKTAALIFFGALAALVLAMFPPGSDTPEPVSIALPRPQASPGTEAAPLIVANSAESGPPAESTAAAKPGPVDPFMAEVRQRAGVNPEETLLWLQENVAGPRRLQAMIEVVALWAAQDSETALLWLEANAEGLARLETLEAGVRLWSSKDPVTAAGWIEGMANDGSKSAAAGALAATWGERAPAEAAGWIRSLEAGPVRSAASASLIEVWSEIAPEEAARWARMEATETNDPALLEEAVERFAAFDPASALDFVQNLTPGKETANAARAYVRSGAREFPTETAAWIAALPADDPLYLDTHAADLMQEWVLSDSVAASAWLESQAEGRLRETAAAAFTEAILPFEPGVAAAWSNTLTDPRQRVESLERSVDAWVRMDTEAARTWIAEADLEPQLRMHLAERLPPDS